MLPLRSLDNVRHNRPGLLVSVRDVNEALAALAGGADVIDVKEPNRGSLGAAEASTIAGVVNAVGGRAPVTAAAGELVDLMEGTVSPMPTGVSLFKIGLAHCAEILNWQSHWKTTIDGLAASAASLSAPQRAVAVAYADWRIANAPPPDEVLRAALDLGCPALLVDTWDKTAGSLFDHWPADELHQLIRSARAHNLALVLAGSLTGARITAATRLHPDLVAVRTAACNAGRAGTVSRERVLDVKQLMEAALQVDAAQPNTATADSLTVGR